MSEIHSSPRPIELDDLARMYVRGLQEGAARPDLVQADTDLLERAADAAVKLWLLEALAAATHQVLDRSLEVMPPWANADHYAWVGELAALAAFGPIGRNRYACKQDLFDHIVRRFEAIPPNSELLDAAEGVAAALDGLLSLPDGDCVHLGRTALGYCAVAKLQRFVGAGATALRRWRAANDSTLDREAE